MSNANQAPEPSMDEILASIRRIVSEDDAPSRQPAAEDSPAQPDTASFQPGGMPPGDMPHAGPSHAGTVESGSPGSAAQHPPHQPSMGNTPPFGTGPVPGSVHGAPAHNGPDQTGAAAGFPGHMDQNHGGTDHDHDHEPSSTNGYDHRHHEHYGHEPYQQPASTGGAEPQQDEISGNIGEQGSEGVFPLPAGAPPVTEEDNVFDLSEAFIADEPSSDGGNGGADAGPDAAEADRALQQGKAEEDERSGFARMIGFIPKKKKSPADEMPQDGVAAGQAPSHLSVSDGAETVPEAAAAFDTPQGEGATSAPVDEPVAAAEPAIAPASPQPPAEPLADAAPSRPATGPELLSFPKVADAAEPDLSPETGGQADADAENTLPASAPGMDAAAAVPQSSSVASGSTLEDNLRAVLKPIIHEWLDTNMPRILEEAVREELAASSKKTLPERS